MRFYTVEQLGEKQALTPEGFLICYDVPLARTGMQIYAAKEVYPRGHLPPSLSPNDPVRVERPEEEVFRQETLDSFNGKVLVDEHPVEGGERVDVTHGILLVVGDAKK